MKNKKGFTLIELLAVIVILGIIMLVAIPAVTGYISNARNDSYLNTASLFLDGVRNVAVSENRLPFSDGQVNLFKVTGTGGIQLESGGTQSPYGQAWDEGYTYVAIAKHNGDYYYAFAGNDADGNYIPLATLEYIRQNKVYVKNWGVEQSRKCIANLATTQAALIESCTATAPDNGGKIADASLTTGFTSLKGSTNGSVGAWNNEAENKIYIYGVDQTVTSASGTTTTQRVGFRIAKVYDDNKIAGRN